MVELVPKQIITQILAFLIMLWILRRFVWKPLLDILSERKQHIKSIYDSAWNTKSHAEAIKVEYQKQLENIHVEAREIIQTAVKEGKQIAAEIEEKSQLKAKEIIENAHIQSERDLKKARIELKKEMIDVSFVALEQLINIKLSPEERDEFAYKMMDNI